MSRTEIDTGPGWHEVALAVRFSVFGYCVVYPILLTFALVGMIGWPLAAQVIWCIIVTVWLLVPALSQCVDFQSALLRCIDRHPIAEEPQDAQQVQWYLETFRGLNRTACRLRRRDHSAMIAACERAARIQEPGRELENRTHPCDAPSLFGMIGQSLEVMVEAEQHILRSSEPPESEPDHEADEGVRNSDQTRP